MIANKYNNINYWESLNYKSSNNMCSHLTELTILTILDKSPWNTLRPMKDFEEISHSHQNNVG